MKCNVAIFPFQSHTLHLARYFDKLQPCYKLNALLSWRGTGLGGRDASVSCNYPELGISVSDALDATEKNWDVLLVDLVEVKNPFLSENPIHFFRRCLEAGKRIIFFVDTLNNLDESIVKLLQAYPEQTEIQASDNSVKHHLSDEERFSAVYSPVLLVGGLTYCQDTLEVVLSLKLSLKNRGYRVSCITSSNIGQLGGLHSSCHIWRDTSLSEEEKILLLNRLARDIIYEERPNLLIAEAPDAVMKFNDTAPNGFGIRTYMMCQALCPSSFICGIPFDLVRKDIISNLSKKFLECYGVEISAAYASNALADNIAILQQQEMSYVRVDSNVVTDWIKQHRTCCWDIPVYDIVSDDAGQICTAVQDRLC